MMYAILSGRDWATEWAMRIKEEKRRPYEEVSYELDGRKRGGELTSVSQHHVISLCWTSQLTTRVHGTARSVASRFLSNCQSPLASSLFHRNFSFLLCLIVCQSDRRPDTLTDGRIFFLSPPCFDATRGENRAPFGSFLVTPRQQLRRRGPASKPTAFVSFSSSIILPEGAGWIISNCQSCG